MSSLDEDKREQLAVKVCYVTAQRNIDIFLITIAITEKWMVYGNNFPKRNGGN